MSNTFTDTDFSERKQDYGSKRFMDGLWRGFCEENADPMGLGRIKVRIPALHGEEEGVIKTQDLPWCSACLPPGGGSDFGGFVVPTKGSHVWVMFEQGDTQYPVWIGSWKAAAKDGKGLSKPKPEDPKHIKRAQSMGDTEWPAPPGSELPREAQAMANHEPTSQIWNKSPKGHTLHVEERDGVERLQLTDRAGNVIYMECPVSPEENAANAAQRNGRSVLTGDQLKRSQMRDTGSKIVIQDQAQSLFQMESREGDENITIAANDGNGGLQAGKNRQKIELLAGANRILVESVKDGKILARLTLDSNSGVVTIEGEVIIDLISPHINLTADHININGDCNVNGDMTLAGRLTGGGV